MDYTVQINDVIGVCDEVDGEFRFCIENVDTDYRVGEYVPMGEESYFLKVAAALQKYIDEQTARNRKYRV